ncbi:MAG: tetrahydrofolate dehydrogenase/cyclohydrolase catalytic domain-containing protein [bacterium]
MMATILDGRRCAENIRTALKPRIARLKTKPGLAIVQVGENPESLLYVRLKERAAAELGIRFEKHLLLATAEQQEVLATVQKLSGRGDIHGIVVQLPLPDSLNTETVLSAVALEKDVDGLHPAFQRALQRGERTPWLPALQQSILSLLTEGRVVLRGKTALLLAKSKEFRLTLGAVLRRQGCSILESETLENAVEQLRSADIVITALGTPHALRDEKLETGTVCIDVGLEKLPDGSVAGDFAGPADPPHVAAYSPVPGGIGPVTVASLLANTVAACEHATRKSLFTLRVSHGTIMWLLPTLALLAAAFFFGGADYRGKLILVCGSALASILWWFVPPRIIRAPWWQNPDLLYLAFLLLAGASTLFSSAPRKSVEDFSLLLLAGLAFLLGRMVPPQRQKDVAALVVLGAVALALWSGWSFLYNNADAYPRLYGPFKNPDGLGAGLLLPLALSVGLIRLAEKRWKKIAAGCCVLILGAAIALTSAVSSFIGLFVAGAAGLIVFRPKVKKGIIGIVLVLLLLAAGLVAIIRGVPLHGSTGTSIITGLSSVGSAGSFSQRISFVQSSLSMLAHHPVFGVGFGLWSDFFPQYASSTLERTELAHGMLPQVAAELGIAGFILFAGLLIAVFTSLLRCVRSGTAGPFAPFGVTGLLALAIAACIDIPWFYPVLLLAFWFFAGVFLVPATQEWTRRQVVVPFRVCLTIVVILLLGYGIARSITTYYVEAAERSAGGAQRDFIDAMATADLAMRILPTPNEELRMSIVLLTQSWSAPDKQKLRTWAERTLHDNPLQPATYLLLGRSVLANGDRAQAASLFQQGLGHDPHFVPDLAIDLTGLYLGDKRYEEARVLAKEQIGRTGESVPNRAASLAALEVNKAKAEIALGKMEDARSSLEQALRDNPENADAKQLLKDQFHVD